MNIGGQAILFLLFAAITSINIYSCGDGDRALEKIVKAKWKVDKRDRIDMAVSQEWEMTKNPITSKVSKHKLEASRKEVQGRLDEQKRHALSNLKWTERGPNNIAGRTRAILIDNGDPTANTVFVGSVAGGLWYSLQANTDKPNWKKIHDIPNNVPITSIAQHPLDHTIIYCATGEGFYNIQAEQGNGIYRSIDGGRTWKVIESTTTDDFIHIQKVIVSGKGDIYAATRSNGLMVSRDQGKSFHQVLGQDKNAKVNDVSDAELASNGDIYVAMGLHNTDGIYKSSDHGESWIKLRSGLPQGGYNRIELACAQSNSQYIYALYNNEKSNNCQGVFRSTDGGEHWIEMSNPEMSAGVNFLRQQGWYNLTAAVDPWNESTLYVGGIDLFKTNNAGLSFQQISHWYGEYDLPNVHADQHVIVFGRNSDNIFFGNDGGIWRTKNATEQRASIKHINTGYNVSQFYAADFHPDAASNMMVAGAQDNGTQLFKQKGMNSTKEISGGDGGFSHIDQSDGNTIISSYVFNNYRVSIDGGKTNEYLNFGNTGKFINPTDYDDQQNILYASSKAATMLRYKMDEAHESVKLLGLEEEKISAISISKHASNRIYIGTDAGNVYVLNDAHQSNQVEAHLLFRGRGYVSSIALDKWHENHISFTYSNYGIASVYESSNTGKTWNCIEGNLPEMPVRWCAYDPTDSKRILLATDLGVWYTASKNAENTKWEPLYTGMESVRVDMLKFRDCDNLLIAATHGRGLFTTEYFSQEDTSL